MKIAKGIRRYGTDTQFKGNFTDLDHEFSNWDICSAHRLTKRNICVKFNENRSKGYGDMERTRIEG